MLQLPGSPDDDPQRQQKFEAIVNAMPGFGGKSVEIRFGIGTWTWPGGTATSNDVAVLHGLGRTPVVAFVSGATAQGAGEVVDGNAFLYTSTQFAARGVFVKGFVPGAGATSTFAWIAIG